MPPHEKTTENASLVVKLAHMNTSKKEICRVLGITEKTLDKYYKAEMVAGRNLLNQKTWDVFNVAYDLCIKYKNPQMVKYWLNTAAGWYAAVAPEEIEAKEKQIKNIQINIMQEGQRAEEPDDILSLDSSEEESEYTH